MSAQLPMLSMLTACDIYRMSQSKLGLAAAFRAVYLRGFGSAVAPRHGSGGQNILQRAEALHVKLAKSCLHAGRALGLCEESACATSMQHHPRATVPQER